jgi:hypothetical protein
MGQLVKVKIRPGSSLQFPAICVNCSRVASERMQLRKRIGRLTRLIDVPLCQQCYREANRLSGDEERWLRFGRLGSFLAAILIFLPFTLLLAGTMPIWLNLLVSAVAAVLAAIGAWASFKKRAAANARPEKLDVLNSVRMDTFSWRATTFRFENANFADRFRDLNRSLLMGVNGPTTDADD